MSRWVGGHEWVGGWVGGEQVGEEGWFGVRHLHAPQAHHSPRIPLASPGWGLLTPPIPPTLGLLRVGNRSPEMASESATTSPLLRSFSTGSCPPPACTSLRVSECCLRVRVSVGGWGHEQRQLPPPPACTSLRGRACARVVGWRGCLEGDRCPQASPHNTHTRSTLPPSPAPHTHADTHTHLHTHSPLGLGLARDVVALVSQPPPLTRSTHTPPHTLTTGAWPRARRSGVGKPASPPHPLHTHSSTHTHHWGLASRAT